MEKHTPRTARRKTKAKAPAARGVNPLSKLLPYQRAWYEDGSRFLVGRWGRQTGKSFSTAAIVAAAMIAQANTMWMIAAPSERQSHEALEKVKQWLAAFECAFADELEELDGIEGKAGVVRLTNGSRCIAVPGKPDTVRGMSANVWLDEFAFFEDPDATWKAILPSITNPLRGGEVGNKYTATTAVPTAKRLGTSKRFFLEFIEGLHVQSLLLANIYANFLWRGSRDC